MFKYEEGIFELRSERQGGAKKTLLVEGAAGRRTVPRLDNGNAGVI